MRLIILIIIFQYTRENRHIDNFDIFLIINITFIYPNLYI